MGKSEQTKAFIIEKTAPLFNSKGYAGTSISDITGATNLTRGSVYAGRSRAAASIYGGECQQFAKISPVELDLAKGRAVVAVTTNERCSDPRLAPE